MGSVLGILWWAMLYSCYWKQLGVLNIPLWINLCISTPTGLITIVIIKQWIWHSARKPSRSMRFKWLRWCLQTENIGESHIHRVIKRTLWLSGQWLEVEIYFPFLHVPSCTPYTKGIHDVGIHVKQEIKIFPAFINKPVKEMRANENISMWIKAEWPREWKWKLKQQTLWSEKLLIREKKLKREHKEWTESMKWLPVA